MLVLFATHRLGCTLDLMKKQVLLIGAGRSTLSLIPYLAQLQKDMSLEVTVADYSLEAAERAVAPYGGALVSSELDIRDETALHQAVTGKTVVISMVPAHMHMPIARACLKFGVHLTTASYITDELRALDTEVKAKSLVFLGECGLDPGLDHMSAMEIIDGIRERDGKVILFESFTGGLLSPQSEGDNPWRYKFTWNPRNVVLAGQGGTVKFIQEGKYKYIPPHMVFRRTEFMEVHGYGRFEGLANRDSLKYRAAYGLDGIPTLYRGTLRRPGFARAWDCFVKLGMTDDSYTIAQTNKLSFREFTNLFLAYNPYDSVELKLMHYLGIPQDSDLMDKLQWAGLFKHDTFPFEEATPAQCLEYILKQVWTLEPEDKDLIVMFHKVGYEIDGARYMIESSMGTEGENAQHTAMAKTVGLPLGMATKAILLGNISEYGVQLPVTRQWYGPILAELRTKYQIEFTEVQVSYKGY